MTALTEITAAIRQILENNNLRQILENQGFSNTELKMIITENRITLNGLKKFIDLLQTFFNKNVDQISLAAPLHKLTTFLKDIQREFANNTSARKSVNKSVENSNELLFKIIQKIRGLTKMEQKELAFKINAGKSFFTDHFKNDYRISFDKLDDLFSFLESDDVPIILIIDTELNQWLQQLSPLLNQYISNQTPLKKALKILKRIDDSTTQAKLGKETNLQDGDISQLFAKEQKQRALESDKNKIHLEKIYQTIVSEGKRLGISEREDFIRCLQEIKNYYALEVDAHLEKNLAQNLITFPNIQAMFEQVTQKDKFSLQDSPPSNDANSSFGSTSPVNVFSQKKFPHQLSHSSRNLESLPNIAELGIITEELMVADLAKTFMTLFNTIQAVLECLGIIPIKNIADISSEKLGFNVLILSNKKTITLGEVLNLLMYLSRSSPSQNYETLKNILAIFKNKIDTELQIITSNQLFPLDKTAIRDTFYKLLRLIISLTSLTHKDIAKIMDIDTAYLSNIASNKPQICLPSCQSLNRLLLFLLSDNAPVILITSEDFRDTYKKLKIYNDTNLKVVSEANAKKKFLNNYKVTDNSPFGKAFQFLKKKNRKITQMSLSPKTSKTMIGKILKGNIKPEDISPNLIAEMYQNLIQLATQLGLNNDSEFLKDLEEIKKFYPKSFASEVITDSVQKKRNFTLFGIEEIIESQTKKAKNTSANEINVDSEEISEDPMNVDNENVGDATQVVAESDSEKINKEESSALHSMSISHLLN